MNIPIPIKNILIISLASVVTSFIAITFFSVIIPRDVIVPYSDMVITKIHKKAVSIDEDICYYVIKSGKSNITFTHKCLKCDVGDDLSECFNK